MLVELHTYRMEAHTNADDATRYRTADQVAPWLQKDPLERLETYLRSVGALDDELAESYAAEGERAAADLRDRMNAEVEPSPESLFENVYAAPTAQLVEQRSMVREEIEAERDAHASVTTGEDA